MARLTGTLALDGTSISMNQGGNATTISAGSPAGDITLTLPATTDTIVGRATTDTLTNKTLTSPTITGATMTTPTLGVATATTINKVTITAPATAATLTIVDGGSLITAGAYSTTLTSTNTTNVTLPTTGTLATLAGSETFTNKSLTSPALTTPTVATGMNVLAEGYVRFQDAAGGEYAGIKAPATIASSYTLTLPDDDGNSGEVLSTNGSGVLDWIPALANPMDSEGDLIYGGVGGAVTKLDAGTANYLLQANGAAAPSWVTNLTTGTINGNTISTGTGTLTLGAGSTLATSATNSITLTSTGATNVTLPTTGTLATLAGSEALTNKTINGNTITSGTGTLTLGAGSTLATSATNSITLTSTGATNVTLPTTGTLATLAGSEALTNKTYNGNTFTAGTGTLTIAASKTLTASNTLTFTGTDGSSAAFGAGGTVAYTANKLDAFAATTSAELKTVISDETGSGALVFANTPTLVTPVLGAATATSLSFGGSTLSTFIDWTSYTPSFSAGFGTPTNVTFSYRVIGKTLEILGSFNCGTVTTGTPTISIPVGYSFNETLTAAKKQIFGTFATLDVTEYNAANMAGVVTQTAAGTDTMALSFISASSTAWDLNNVNGRWSTGDGITLHAMIIID